MGYLTSSYLKRSGELIFFNDRYEGFLLGFICVCLDCFTGSNMTRQEPSTRAPVRMSSAPRSSGSCTLVLVEHHYRRWEVVRRGVFGVLFIAV